MKHAFHSVYSTYEECLLKNRGIDDAAAFLSRVGIRIKLIHGSHDMVIPLDRPHDFYAKYNRNTQLDVMNGKYFVVSQHIRFESGTESNKANRSF